VSRQVRLRSAGAALRLGSFAPYGLPTLRHKMSYNKLYDACAKRFKDLPKSVVQEKCNAIWKSLKDDNKRKDDLDRATAAKVTELLAAATKEKARLLNYFAQVS
jgi:hypothetical protein